MGDDIGLAHAGFEHLEHVLIHPVDHRRRLVEQCDLVDILDLACVEQHLLRIANFQADLFKLVQHRRFDNVDAERHFVDAVFDQQRLDLLGSGLHQSDVGRHRAAQADHAGMAATGTQGRQI